jgi:hypothetical protein
MHFRIIFVAALTLFGCLSVSATAGQDFATFDTDGNGLLTETEAQAGGRALFQKLDTDNSGSLDARELGGRFGGAVLKAADVDADGALNAEEYTGLLVARFKSANTDGNGAVEEQELDALAGALLLVMLRP